jgi:hypothetical protein
LAIQDAVAAANMLTRPLRRKDVPEAVLAAVQKRRELPTRITQAVQVQLHKGFARVFEASGPVKAPWQLKLALRIPGVHRALGYAVGIGVRPEHIPDSARQSGRKRYVLAAAIGALGAAVTIIAVLRKKHHYERSPVSPAIR